ncbi:MAG: hypothetical protein ACFFBS_03520 [Promethearchaeota archaeon]
MDQHYGSELEEKMVSQMKTLKTMIESITHQIEALQRTISESFESLQSALRVSSEESPTPMREMFSASSNQFSDRYSELSWALSRTLRAVKEAYNTDSSGITARKLANEINVSRSRASELLNELVTKGHLEKHQKERSMRFRPTK